MRSLSPPPLRGKDYVPLLFDSKSWIETNIHNVGNVGLVTRPDFSCVRQRPGGETIFRCLLQRLIAPPPASNKSDNENLLPVLISNGEQLAAGIRCKIWRPLRINGKDHIVFPDQEVGIEVPSSATVEQGNRKTACRGIPRPGAIRGIENVSEPLFVGVQVTIAIM
jgi:hypothetical protein